MAGTRWMEQAACQGRPELDWFDLDCNLQQTLTICMGCTVKERCLEFAVEHRMVEGVWGGLYGKNLHAMVEQHRSNHATPDDAA